MCKRFLTCSTHSRAPVSRTHTSATKARLGAGHRNATAAGAPTRSGRLGAGSPAGRIAVLATGAQGSFASACLARNEGSLSLSCILLIPHPLSSLGGKRRPGSRS